MATNSLDIPVALLQLWQSVPLLADVPVESVRALASLATSRRYQADEVIFLEGDPVAGLFLIEEGAVKISRFSKEGREHILLVLHAGDTFNDVAALDGEDNPATAIAHADSIVWRIQRADLKRVVDRDSELAWALIESIARRTRHLVSLVQDLSMRNVKGRLARLLLQQAANQQDPEVERLLTQEEMASRLGTVREVVGRALRSLADEGIIEFDRHRIVILDADRLSDEAEI